MQDIFTRSARSGQRADGRLQIEGSVRSNLIAAIASVRRLRGKPVHEDTVSHWRRLLDYARRSDGHGEAVTDLVAELESELPAQQRAPTR
jgi:hypothetical protein